MVYALLFTFHVDTSHPSVVGDITGLCAWTKEAEEFFAKKCHCPSKKYKVLYGANPVSYLSPT